MKRREFFLAPTAAAAQTIQSPSTRPRLYFNASDVSRLRTRITRDPAFRQTWSALLDSAKRLLDARLVPEEDALRGGGQHANYAQPGAQISAMGLTLSLAWHVTGERQYAEKLRGAMLHYSAYRAWNGPGKEGRDPQWKSELGGARFCYGVGCGYDALHSFLSPDDRKQIASAIARLGVLPVVEDWLLPQTRIHALDSMGHNWWAVCVSMAGVAVLALGSDDARTTRWLDLVTRGLALWFDFKGSPLQNKVANFDSAGAFYEGVGYANYALSEYLRFRLAQANVFPTRLQPRFKALEQTTDFFLQTLYPTSSSFYTVNFGDGGLHVDSSATIRLLIENGFSHPNAGWYLDKVKSGRAILDPLDLLARKSASLASPERLPQSMMYSDIGWAMLRSSWKDDSTLLAVRSGFTWNHSHADAGSFVLFHKGRPLITDSGACSYANPLYVRYYVQSRAHNVVLFQGEGQPAEDIRRGVKNPGRLLTLIDGLGVKYISADATGPMSHRLSRNFRHWVWVDGAIILFDDVRAHQDGRLDWLLHYDGDARVDDNRVELSNADAKAELRFLHPAALSHREEKGFADHRPDREVPYLAFSTPAAVREEKFVVAILPSDPDKPDVEAINGNLAIGARVKHGAATTDLYLNLQADGRRMHDNSNNTIAGWETDAYLLGITRSGAAGEPSRFFVVNGSYLRKDGRVALDSFSKLDAVWRPGSHAEMWTYGQPAIEVSIGSAERPQTLSVNGRTTRFDYDSDARVASFRRSL